MHYQDWVEKIQDAYARNRKVILLGNGTKSFWGKSHGGTDELILSLAENHGIIDYQPTELIITVRAGTLIADVITLLAANDQMLPFEPVLFGESATIGGMVACGVSGPGQLAYGPMRDHVLGIVIIDGKGRLAHFGGQVIKNVAGFDVSRLMVGARGTLGVLLEVTFKVLPKPKVEQTLVWKLTESEALHRLSQWMMNGWPITASCYRHGLLNVRFSGGHSLLSWLGTQLDGTKIETPSTHWAAIREQSWIEHNQPIWRWDSQSPYQPTPKGLNCCFIDQGGSVRYLTETIIESTPWPYGGQIYPWRNLPESRPKPKAQQPLVQAFNKKIRQVFDPNGIFNPLVGF